MKREGNAGVQYVSCVNKNLIYTIILKPLPTQVNSKDFCCDQFWMYSFTCKWTRKTKWLTSDFAIQEPGTFWANRKLWVPASTHLSCRLPRLDVVHGMVYVGILLPLGVGFILCLLTYLHFARHSGHTVYYITSRLLATSLGNSDLWRW